MNPEDKKALDKIRQGFENIVPRISKEGANVRIVQGTETITLPIAQSVTTNTVVK